MAPQRPQLRGSQNLQGAAKECETTNYCKCLKIGIPNLPHSGCVVECRICNREVARSNVVRSYFTARSTQPSIPPGSVNEYQLRLGMHRQVWLIRFADETQSVHAGKTVLSFDNACCI